MALTLKKIPETLEIVQEEDHDSDRETNIQTLVNDIRDNIFEDIVYEFILLHADSVVRVHSFLLMLIHRRRYAKLKAALTVIQSRCKNYLARMKVKKLR
jgi:hypothetical protein